MPSPGCGPTRRYDAWASRSGFIGFRDALVRDAHRLLESLPRTLVEIPSPPAVFCGGRRWRSRMRGLSRHSHDLAMADVRMKVRNAPSSAYRHLLPRKTAG